MIHTWFKKYWKNRNYVWFILLNKNGSTKILERKLFGTDGIRGVANKYPIVPDLIMRVAMAASWLFAKGEEQDDNRHTVVIGKDTRQSGYMIENALTAGFAAMGVDVILVGPMPTPAVSILTRALRADLGVMISASHNPYQDNGIKFFNADGVKLTDNQEKELESLILRESEDFSQMMTPRVGKVRRIDAQGRYIEYAKATLDRGVNFRGLKIVVDCAHGAAYKVAPQVLWELGAKVIAINDQPNGININDHCGATATKGLQEAVVVHGADLGIALDGDADRLIMVDEKGGLVDGDHLMALLASAWKLQGKLKGNMIIGTLMSNLGFERYLSSIGLELFRANVGDRYVIEAMHERNCNLGGEQSGHLIMSDYSSTGDGLIAALQVLQLFIKKGGSFSHFSNIFTPVPQLLRNLRVRDKSILKETIILRAIEQAQQSLEAIHGRLLVRPSGTEPIVRLMGEADDIEKLTDIIDRLQKAFVEFI